MYRPFAFTLGLFILHAGIAQAQDQIGTAAVSAPVVIVPQVGRTPLATLPPGTSVRIIGKEGDWYRVAFRDQRFGERVGYMLAEHVNLAPVAVPAPVPVQPPAAAPTSQPVAPSPMQATPATATGARLAPASAPAANTVPTTKATRFGGLSERSVSDAVTLGQRQKGRSQGLRLLDSGQSFLAAMTAGGTGPTASSGFRVQVYTPLAWIRQLASDAAKEYRSFTIDDVVEEATEPVLRIIAFPDTPNTVTAAGMTGTSSVQHVVLRSEDRTLVIQPIFKEAFTEEAANAVGGRATFQGLLAKFPMDGLRELRGPRGDREFFITVVGSTGEEKNFKVKRKHFDDLPM